MFFVEIVKNRSRNFNFIIFHLNRDLSHIDGSQGTPEHFLPPVTIDKNEPQLHELFLIGVPYSSLLEFPSCENVFFFCREKREARALI